MEQKKANDKHLDIGCKGPTPFMVLPNFDWQSFWVPGIAHALLLGVLKDVTQLLFRDKQNSIPHGRQYFVPDSARKRMLALVKKLSPTSGYPRGLTNILTCDSRHSPRAH
jgi:hypothetical protein